MVNRYRGEVAVELDGKQWVVCLTLGALAEWEAAFEVDDLSALATRFGSGKLSAKDMLRILGAGLRGAGHPLTDEEVAEMQVRGGALGYAQIVSELLKATFSADTDDVTA